MRNKFEVGQMVYHIYITDNKLTIQSAYVTKIGLHRDKPDGNIIYEIDFPDNDFDEDCLFSTFAEAKEAALKQINELTE